MCGAYYEKEKREEVGMKVPLVNYGGGAGLDRGVTL